MAGQAYNIPPLSMIMFGVSELDRSVAFYQDRLGIKVRQRIPGFAFLDSGAVTLVLSEDLARNISPHYRCHRGHLFCGRRPRPLPCTTATGCRVQPGASPGLRTDVGRQFS